METRTYRGLKTPIGVLGLGAAQVGDASVSEEDAAALLNGALDLGVTLIDTARGYGHSEDRIGRHIAHRRDAYVLSTKVGYGVEGEENWTGPCITKGVELALRLMKTDHVDICHLHSCPKEMLATGEVTEALLDCVERGLVRIPAYSGEDEALTYAINTGDFKGFEASVNVCDQRVIDGQIPKMLGAGMIAKRPLMNVAWTFDERPRGTYAEEYWVRLHEMGADLGEEPAETTLRFSAFTPGVTCVITGTKNLDHLKRNVEFVSRGPLEPARYVALREAFMAHDAGWVGQV